MKRKSFRKLQSGILAAALVLGCLSPAWAESEYVYEDDTVKLAPYEGLTYSAVLAEVTDQEVEDTINEILDSYATFEQVTEGEAKDGDTVNIDYIGTIAAEDVKTAEEETEAAEEEAAEEETRATGEEAAAEETEAAEEEAAAEETEAAEEETEAAEEETEAVEEETEAAEVETEAAEEEAAEEETEAAEDETEAVEEEAAEEETEATAEEGAAEAGSEFAADDENRVKFDGGSAEDAELTLGSNSFIPGFEEGVVGMKVGETKDIAVTFPEDYYEELAGVDAIFTVTLNYINGEKIIPELTDEWVQDNEGAESVDAFRQQTREDLEQDAQDVYDNEIRTEVLSSLFDASEVLVYDEDAIDRNIESNRQMYEMYAQMYGMTYEDFLAAMGTDEETLTASMEVEARESQKQVVILNKIAELEGISVSDEDFEKFLADTAAQYGYSEEDAAALDYEGDEELLDDAEEIEMDEDGDVFEMDELTAEEETEAVTGEAEAAEETEAAEEAEEAEAVEETEAAEEAEEAEAAEETEAAEEAEEAEAAEETEAAEEAEEAEAAEETEAAEEAEDAEAAEETEAAEDADPVESFLNDYAGYYGYDSIDTLRAELRNSHNASLAAEWVVDHAVYQESTEEEMAPVEETSDDAQAVEETTEAAEAAGTAAEAAAEAETAAAEETEAAAEENAEEAETAAAEETDAQ